MGNLDQYYAVARGRKIGVYRTWKECKAQVHGFQNPRFKKFATETEARKFVGDNLLVAGEKPTSGPPKTPASSSANFSRKRRFETGASSSVPSKKTKEDDIMDVEFVDAPVVYTDGACSSTGKNDARAGWGVYWGDDDDDNEYGPVYGAATNNRGELIAVEKALEKAIEKKLPKVVIKTDSNLVVQTMDKWIHGWKRKGWKTRMGAEVVNKDVIVKIDNLRQKTKVKFVHVRGHSGIDGNEKASELARKGAKMYNRSDDSELTNLS